MSGWRPTDRRRWHSGGLHGRPDPVVIQNELNGTTLKHSNFRVTDDLVLTRMGLGAMQLAGPMAWGPPKDRDAAIAVLREVVALGLTHIDTSDYYGPHVVNNLIREALHPYPDDLHIVTKVGARRASDKLACCAVTKRADFGRA